MGKNKIDFNNMDLGFDKTDQTDQETVFRKINIKQLDENPENNEIYEHDKDADEFLKEDIKRNGMLNPIVVVKSELHAMRYTIISGHRRTRIAKELGMIEIEARELITITPEQKALAKIMLITANSTQRDRKPSERAKEVKYLKEQLKNSTIKNIAKWISNATQMSERNVSRYDKLAEQSKDIQESVDKGEITLKDAIGERREKKINKNNFDINKRIKKVYNFINEINDEMINDSGQLFDKNSIEYLKRSNQIIQGILESESIYQEDGQ